jgi:hypothetical protein
MAYNIGRIHRRLSRRLHRFFLLEEPNTGSEGVDLSRLQPASIQILPILEATFEYRIRLDQHHDLELSFTWPVIKQVTV